MVVVVVVVATILGVHVILSVIKVEENLHTNKMGVLVYVLQGTKP